MAHFGYQSEKVRTVGCLAGTREAVHGKVRITCPGKPENRHLRPWKSEQGVPDMVVHAIGSEGATPLIVRVFQPAASVDFPEQVGRKHAVHHA